MSMLNADMCSQPSCARNCVFPHPLTRMSLRSTGVCSRSQITEPSLCFRAPQMSKADDNSEPKAPVVRALGRTRHWEEPGTGRKGQVEDTRYILSLSVAVQIHLCTHLQSNKGGKRGSGGQKHLIKVKEDSQDQTEARRRKVPYNLYCTSLAL